MEISLIAAVSKNQVIGVSGKLPWYIPEDLRHFRRITLGKSIVMGRKTCDSIGQALPHRKNIVLTHNLHYVAGGCTIVHTPEEAILESDSNEVIIIGGAEVYRAFLPKITRCYLTLVHSTFSGDAFFPELDRNIWHEIEREDIEKGPKSGLGYSFIVLERS